MKTTITQTQRHPYHIVTQSPWPLLTGFSSLFVTFGLTMYMHKYSLGYFLFIFGIICLISCMAIWWRDVIRESTFEGKHTTYVQKGLRIGMILFIISEIMFFVAFFWGFFHSSLAPTIAIGCVWPPIGIEPISAFGLPLLNTLLLLTSGATVTWTHHSIISGNKQESVISLFLTIILALIFTVIQVFEYIQAPFTISSGIYGSTFFMSTGFHGFHVLIGTLFLSVCLYRLIKGHFTKEHHLGFEAAAWYWHFVDVVWLFLFVSVYWWGGA